MNTALRPFSLFYYAVLDFFRFLGDLTYLVADATRGVHRSLLDKASRPAGVGKPLGPDGSRGGPKRGHRCLVLFCIGAILALQMAPVLRKNIGEGIGSQTSSR